MKISQLMERLQEVLMEHDDVEVLFAANAESDDEDDGSTVPIEGVVLGESAEEGVVDYVLICDIHTLDAFR